VILVDIGQYCGDIGQNWADIGQYWAILGDIEHYWCNIGVILG
jgi:hypothetical protein